MPTILTHAVVPLAIGLGLGSRRIPPRLLCAAMLAAILPDLDVVAFALHIPYADDFGHRGASHSLLFALLVGVLALLAAPLLRCSRGMAFGFVGLAGASHGLLDMFTNGGLGVALWWPWSAERLFMPWQVIEVSPLTVQRLLSPRGVAVLQSELLWVWLPAAALACGLLIVRKIGSMRDQSTGTNGNGYHPDC
jgi:inner membrane protein